MNTTDKIYYAAEDYIMDDWRHSGTADAMLRDMIRDDLSNWKSWDILVKAGLDGDLCSCVAMLDCGQYFEVSVFATKSPHAAEVSLTISKPPGNDPEGATHVVASWEGGEFTLRREFTQARYAIDWLRAHVDTSRMIDGPPSPEDWAETMAQRVC